MRLLVILLIFINFKIYNSISKEILLPLDPQQEECILQLKIDRDLMAYLSAQEFPPENDETFNEFFACTWKKQGYQRTNGELNYKAIESMVYSYLKEQAGTSRSAINIAKQMANIAVEECKENEGNSHGQVAVMTENCIYRKLLALADRYRYVNNSESSKLW